MTKDEELRLIKKAQNGSSSAFEDLVKANEKIVYNLALKSTGNPDDAMDISQEVFIKAYTALAAFRGDSRFSVWLYRLTKNACADHFRKAKTGTVVPLMTDDEEEMDIPDSRETPEEDYVRRETQHAVRNAIDSLPADKREILIMREFSGMNYADIAETLGISEGTVKSRIARARESLAEILIKNGTFPKPVPSKKVKGGSSND